MGASPYTVTRGIVLRETPVGDTDKILTLLTEDRGKTAVIAKGVRRKNSKYAAAAQSLAYSEWTLYQRGEWYHANEASTLELFTGLRESLEAMALASYFAELCEAAAVEEVAAGALLRHLLNGLYALSALHKPPGLVKPVFELKFCALAGYEPLLDACALCGNPEPLEPCLDLSQGVLRCRTCGTGGGLHCGPGGGISGGPNSGISGGPGGAWHSGGVGYGTGGGTADGSGGGAGFASSRAAPLCRDSLAAARRTLYGDERRLYAFRMGDAALARFSAAAEAFLLAQMDRRFRTLEFYKSLVPMETAGT